jgi:hypothetical protein
MKNLILTFTLLFTFSFFAQNSKFELSDDKPTFPPQFVVIEKEGMSVEEGYQRVIEWISVTYKNPDEVIKSQIENKYIRIEGFSSGLYIADRMGMIPPYDVKYVITFNFKENRIKFDVDSGTFYISSTQYTSGGWYDLLFENEGMYKKNGKPRYALTKANVVMDYFNNLASSLQNYVDTPVEVATDDDDDW